jgi:hypothetical protein
MPMKDPTEIEKMIQELNQYILPGTLMESFDAYREEAYRRHSVRSRRRP